MGQKINIKIHNETLSLIVKNSEQESAIRHAAEAVNRELDEYDSKYPGVTPSQKLSLISLNSLLRQRSYQAELGKIKEDVSRMEKELGGYLDNIGK